MVGYNILPIGFTQYEKSTIETFFRLAGRRAPHWGLTTLSSEARVILFNATSKQDVEAFKSIVASWQKVIVVGGSDYGTGWSVLPRPIKLTSILSVLDEIAKAAEPKAASSQPVVEIANSKQTPTDVFANVTVQAAKVEEPESFQSQIDETTESLKAQKKPQNLTKSGSLTPLHNAPSFTPSVPLNLDPNNHNAKELNATTGTVLIVDDSDIALKYMQNRLRHFGYESDMARSGDEALAMVSNKSYQFVFLDVMMQGLDGYQVCRAIKNNKARRGPAPVVVMLTSRGGTIDKIRGTMAGCNAYMTKPLNEKQLTSVLTKFDDSTMTQRYETANPRLPLVDSYAPVKR